MLLKTHSTAAVVQSRKRAGALFLFALFLAWAACGPRFAVAADTRAEDFSDVGPEKINAGIAVTLKTSGDPEELRDRVESLARLGSALRKLRESRQKAAS